mmetsp:Transcript_41952/g.98419  ORF Transcript_41952/g.98419 Transcript_41952/m.98419 type:complete len:243 (-) Transcript_41952:453-1181(-)
MRHAVVHVLTSEIPCLHDDLVIAIADVRSLPHLCEKVDGHLLQHIHMNVVELVWICRCFLSACILISTFPMWGTIGDVSLALSCFTRELISSCFSHPVPQELLHAVRTIAQGRPGVTGCGCRLQAVPSQRAGFNSVGALLDMVESFTSQCQEGRRFASPCMSNKAKLHRLEALPALSQSCRKGVHVALGHVHLGFALRGACVAVPIGNHLGHFFDCAFAFLCHWRGLHWMRWLNLLAGVALH